MKNIYKTGAKLKLRFETSKGQLTIEQLFDLPLISKTKVSLNDVAVTISDSITKVKDFVGVETSSNKIAELKLEIVKDIIETKKRENEIKANKAKTSEEIAKLENILAMKKAEEIAKLSAEEIEKKLSALKG